MAILTQMSAVSFRATEADLIAAYRLHFLDSLRRRRAQARFVIGAAIFALLSAIGFGSEGGWLVAAVIGAAYWLGLLAIILGLNYLLLPRRVGRIYAQQKSLHDDATIEWSDSAIDFVSARGNSRIPWTDFVRILESRDIIILMQSDALFNFIPKSALSDAQAASIMAFAK